MDTKQMKSELSRLAALHVDADAIVAKNQRPSLREGRPEETYRKTEEYRITVALPEAIKYHDEIVTQRNAVVRQYNAAIKGVSKNA